MVLPSAVIWLWGMETFSRHTCLVRHQIPWNLPQICICIRLYYQWLCPIQVILSPQDNILKDSKWTSLSGQHERTITEFILPSETTEQMYETMVHKTLVIRQPRMVILERWEANKVSPMIALALCLEKVSRFGTGKGKSSRAWLSPWAGDRTVSVRKPKYLESTGQVTRGKRTGHL